MRSLLCLMLSIFALNAHAETAVGIGLSSISSGVSAYTDLDSGHFVQGILGITRPFAVVADYCWRKPLKKEFSWYLGAGGYMAAYRRYRDDDAADIGVRMPVGILFQPKEIHLAAELAPAFTSGPYLVVDVAVAVRVPL